jgi:hypothetical protein
VQLKPIGPQTPQELNIIPIARNVSVLVAGHISPLAMCGDQND